MPRPWTRSNAAPPPAPAAAARPDLSRVRGAIWIQTHDQPFEYRTPNQQPSLFYMPDLPAQPITPRERFPWAAAIEALTADVRGEYLAAVDAGAQHAPYVDANTRSPIWRELRGNRDWSSLHLYKVAEETPFARLFPKTLKALEAADVVRVDGRPVELFFSRLKPGDAHPAALRDREQPGDDPPAADRAGRLRDPRRQRDARLA